jgi:formylglycine-generating enzyme required for sulfatase activity
MVVIPAGVAVLGARADDPLRNPDELPRLTIRIAEPFEVGRHEITRDEYGAFANATGRVAGGHCLTDRRKPGDWQYDATTTWLDPGFAQSGGHPVACVSFEDARAFVDWLNARTRGGYRLLTEVEWEYVARAGGAGDYAWGDGTDGCRAANGFDATARDHYRDIDTSGYKIFDPLPCSDGFLHTAPVGSLAANAFGVHDMNGNVSEWVEDCHTPSHDTPLPTTCTRRLAKGGSWGTLTHNLRIADRFPYPPTHRDDSIGIRVARTIAPQH